MNECSVLLVEDDPNVQVLLSRLLRRHCSTVATAMDGDEAVDQLNLRHFDLVVLDLMMPRRNGFEVYDAIKEMPEPPKVIVLSAISRYFAHRFGSDVVILQKPFEIDELEQSIRRLQGDLGLDEPGPQDQHPES